MAIDGQGRRTVVPTRHIGLMGNTNGWLTQSVPGQVQLEANINYRPQTFAAAGSVISLTALISVLLLLAAPALRRRVITCVTEARAARTDH